MFHFAGVGMMNRTAECALKSVFQFCPLCRCNFVHVVGEPAVSCSENNLSDICVLIPFLLAMFPVFLKHIISHTVILISYVLDKIHV
uniref:Uncharacterized protein n=1 Tax=Arion vulgaris TaxID=1028688 RepID=A0A0B7B0I1_9EUPU